MKKKDFEWKLQLMAEGEPEPGEGGEPEGHPEGDPGVDRTPEPGKPEAKYTDEDIDRIFAKKFAEMEKKKKKEIDEATRLAKMTEAEKQAHKTEQLEAELKELKAANAKAEMSKVARGMFSEKGISASDAIISMLVKDDADSTKEAVESYIEIFNAEVAKAVKDRMKGETPKKGSSGSTMTREEILSVKNRSERQKLINEHKELFGI